MKQVLFYVVFWMFSGGGLYSNNNIEITVQQPFSNAHVVVTKGEPNRLKDIDVANPLFIFK